MRYLMTGVMCQDNRTLPRYMIWPYLTFDLQGKGLDFIGRRVKYVSYGLRGKLYCHGTGNVFGQLPFPFLPSSFKWNSSPFLPWNYSIFLYDFTEGNAVLSNLSDMKPWNN